MALTEIKTPASMDLNPLILLQKLYEIHDRSMEKHSWACRESCSACCTRNVTMTTLEGIHILQKISPGKRLHLLTQVRSIQPGKRYQPKLTTNGFADACMSGHDIPDEENEPSWGKCPLLQDDRCLIYDTRPMGCRVMASKTRCDDQGGAFMDEIFITMSQVFLQYTEHIDHNGFYGNLTDILLFLENREDPSCKESMGFPILKNRAASFLMVPPEHKAAIRPVIEKIQKNLFRL